MTLTEFLLARIAEDEAATVGHLDNYVQRARAECEAKRRIVDAHLAQRAKGKELAEDLGATGAVLAMAGIWMAATELSCLHLAAVYADHPDYREEWKP